MLLISFVSLLCVNHSVNFTRPVCLFTITFMSPGVVRSLSALKCEHKSPLNSLTTLKSAQTVSGWIFASANSFTDVVDFILGHCCCFCVNTLRLSLWIQQFVLWVLTPM